MEYPFIQRLPKFEYLAPTTIDEAAFMLSKHKGKARVIAGGTDLLQNMKRRVVIPAYLVGLKSIRGLDYIDYDEKRGLRFGPLVTLHAIETSALIRDKFPVLSQSASSIGSAQIRNLGTVVGNLSSAVPSADMAPGLIVLGARLKIANTKGDRNIRVEDFFGGPSVSVLSNNELVVEVQVPNPPASTGMVYIKHTARAAMELAIVGVATIVTLRDGVCDEVKIALGAVAPTPIRATKAEAVLKGRTFNSELARKAAEMASEEAFPVSDFRASAEYRKAMIRILSARALIKASEEIR